MVQFQHGCDQVSGFFDGCKTVFVIIILNLSLFNHLLLWCFHWLVESSEGIGQVGCSIVYADAGVSVQRVGILEEVRGWLELKHFGWCWVCCWFVVFYMVYWSSGDYFFVYLHPVV